MYTITYRPDQKVISMEDIPGTLHDFHHVSTKSKNFQLHSCNFPQKTQQKFVHCHVVAEKPLSIWKMSMISLSGIPSVEEKKSNPLYGGFL